LTNKENEIQALKENVSEVEKNKELIQAFQDKSKESESILDEISEMEEENEELIRRLSSHHSIKFKFLLIIDVRRLNPEY
jgi:prefoldin subunit 5